MAQQAAVRVNLASRWLDRLRPSVRRAQNQLAQAIAADARRLVRVRTGALRASIQARGPRVYVGGPSAPYWHFHEFGTRAHTILPRHKQALWWPGARHPVARVQHPGTKANPFMRTALYRHRQLSMGGPG